MADINHEGFYQDSKHPVTRCARQPRFSNTRLS